MGGGPDGIVCKVGAGIGGSLQDPRHSDERDYWKHLCRVKLKRRSGGRRIGTRTSRPSQASRRDGPCSLEEWPDHGPDICAGQERATLAGSARFQCAPREAEAGLAHGASGERRLKIGCTQRFTNAL